MQHRADARLNSAPEQSGKSPVVLWWSRSGREYSRDRVLRQAFRSLGWRITDFRPTLSGVADIEAGLRRIARPDLVWVPCFRHRDVTAAQRWANRRRVPLIFDPLISAWDKQVFERKKMSADSRAAKRLCQWESRLFRNSDLVIADTDCHADSFRCTHGTDQSRLCVIPVGAEEELFRIQPPRSGQPPVRAMFYGSFIGLQGPQFIAEAAKLVTHVEWTFIGSGPLLSDCMNRLKGCKHVTFIPRVPYDELPSRIGDADILLGIFGTSAKAGRVIPNKVYQSLACGRPVITQSSAAYPSHLRQMDSGDSGITWVPPGRPADIAEAVRRLAAAPAELASRSATARRSYEESFCSQAVMTALASALVAVGVADVGTARRAA